MAEEDIDILIVGGGLTGESLLLALRGMGYRTYLVEAKALTKRVKADFDARTLALAPASVQILKMIQVWPFLCDEATPIETIHISERHGFGSARLQGEAHEPLGYVVEMQHLNRALQRLLDSKEIIAPAKLIALDAQIGKATIQIHDKEQTIQAKLIVAADGTDSTVRKLCGLTPQIKDYDQVAIVANIGLARPHQQQAFERFTTSGPMAMLPLSGLRASLVWAMPPDVAHPLMSSHDADFLKTLQQSFGYRLGRFVKVGRRTTYPLRQIMMPESIIGKVVFIGNAAHTLHPVAGQGFNLGLRDVATLAQCIAKEGLTPPPLKNYQQTRHHDQTAIACLTDGLISLFTSHLPLITLARSAGLMTLNNSTLLKKLLTRYARGYGGIPPDLVCGLPLV